MADLTALKKLVHRDDITHVDRLVLLVGSTSGPITREALSELCRDVGLDSLADHLSTCLERAKKFLIKTKNGLELNERGLGRARELGGGSARGKAIDPLLTQLHAAAAKLPNADTRAFIAEAIECLDNGLYRAGIVLSWVGAVAVLQEYTLTHHLAPFNVEAAARFGTKEWKKPAKVATDFGRLKEADFLLVLESISMISKNVKQELEGCLRLRNSCGHPTGLKVGEHKAAAHVETLLQNVYAVFG